MVATPPGRINPRRPVAAGSCQCQHTTGFPCRREDAFWCCPCTSPFERISLRAGAAMEAAPAPLPAPVADWWERVNGSPAWQDGIFWALAVLYGAIATASFVSVSSSSVNIALYGRLPVEKDACFRASVLNYLPRRDTVKGISLHHAIAGE